jgi:transcription antitermination factor NusG
MINEKSEEVLVSELKSISIMEFASQQLEITVRPELVAGTRVMVKRGPFSNMNGVVERRKGRTLISINIEILGQSASTEIDVEDLEIDE